jgi:hypothetical protein
MKLAVDDYLLVSKSCGSSLFYFTSLSIHCVIFSISLLFRVYQVIIIVPSLHLKTEAIRSSETVVTACKTTLNTALCVQKPSTYVTFLSLRQKYKCPQHFGSVSFSSSNQTLTNRGNGTKISYFRTRHSNVGYPQFNGSMHSVAKLWMGPLLTSGNTVITQPEDERRAR